MATPGAPATQVDSSIPLKSWPQPPPFYTHFTPANLAALRRIRKENTANLTTEPPTEAETTTDSTTPVASAHPPPKPPLDPTTLPPELRFLLPPALPPTTTPYTSFSDYPIIQPTPAPPHPLSTASIAQLYPSHPSTHYNPAPHLLRLVRHLLSTFLSLVGALAADPAGAAGERTAVLRTVMVNILDLANRYRPHQVREGFLAELEGRVEGLRGEVRLVREAGETVREVLRGVEERAGGAAREGEAKAEGGVGEDEREEGGGKEGMRDARVEGQRGAWEALEREFGGETG